MDNQHRQIKGYKELSQTQIDLMNTVKEYGRQIGMLIEDLAQDPEVDQRWLAIGKTELQKGLMSVTRSISKPDFF